MPRRRSRACRASLEFSRTGLPTSAADRVFDASRFNSDPAYRQSVANMNLLTYLIDHRDTRPSNFLISTDQAHPRTFAVDNGLAFSGFRNPLAYFTKTNWAKIIVPELPREQLERLRKLTRHDLDTLLTVAQYSVTPEGLVEVPPTAGLLGLERREARGERDSARIDTSRSGRSRRAPEGAPRKGRSWRDQGLLNPRR